MAQKRTTLRGVLLGRKKPLCVSNSNLARIFIVSAVIEMSEENLATSENRHYHRDNSK
jgi:hypothetical protein